jgi:hypothetical protein
VSVTTSTLFHGSTSTDVRLVHLDATKAVFYGHRDLLGSYARLAVRVGLEWFDVEGVVIGRPSTGSRCMCTMSFASMSSGTMAHLAQALHKRRSTTKLEAIKQARRDGAIAGDGGAPISRRTHSPDERRLHELYRDALKKAA